jgi:hypothetical protein
MNHASVATAIYSFLRMQPPLPLNATCAKWARARMDQPVKPPTKQCKVDLLKYLSCL